MGLKGEIHFSGLAIYYLLYLEATGPGGENKAKKKKMDGDDDLPSTKSTSHADRSQTDKVEYKGVCELLKPWSWPEEGA